VRLDDNQTRIFGARADVTGAGAWEPPCRGIGIAKILKKLQLHPRQGCHPVDVGLMPAPLAIANFRAGEKSYAGIAAAFEVSSEVAQIRMKEWRLA
jgi:hypothetical protein